MFLNNMLMLLFFWSGKSLILQCISLFLVVCCFSQKSRTMPLVTGMLNMIMGVEKLDNIKRDMRKINVNTTELCETTLFGAGDVLKRL